MWKSRALVLGAVLWSVLPGAAVAGDAPAAGPEEVVRALTRAIDHFDLEGFVASFSEDVTMFYPIASLGERVDGRDALAETQEQVFASLAARFAAEGKTEPPYFGLVPRGLETRMLGEEAAVVTWHVDRGTHLGRRTAVLERRDGRWQIVSYHASNIPTPAD